MGRYAFKIAGPVWGTLVSLDRQRALLSTTRYNLDA